MEISKNKNFIKDLDKYVDESKKLVDGYKIEIKDIFMELNHDIQLIENKNFKESKITAICESIVYLRAIEKINNLISFEKNKEIKNDLEEIREKINRIILPKIQETQENFSGSQNKIEYKKVHNVLEFNGLIETGLENHLKGYIVFKYLFKDKVESIKDYMQENLYAKKQILDFPNFFIEIFFSGIFFEYYDALNLEEQKEFLKLFIEKFKNSYGDRDKVRDQVLETFKQKLAQEKDPKTSPLLLGIAGCVWMKKDFFDEIDKLGIDCKDKNFIKTIMFIPDDVDLISFLQRVSPNDPNLEDYLALASTMKIFQLDSILAPFIIEGLRKKIPLAENMVRKLDKEGIHSIFNDSISEFFKSLSENDHDNILFYLTFPSFLETRDASILKEIKRMGLKPMHLLCFSEMGGIHFEDKMIASNLDKIASNLDKEDLGLYDALCKIEQIKQREEIDVCFSFLPEHLKDNEVMQSMVAQIKETKGDIEEVIMALQGTIAFMHVVKDKGISEENLKKLSPLFLEILSIRDRSLRTQAYRFFLDKFTGPTNVERLENLLSSSWKGEGALLKVMSMYLHVLPSESGKNNQIYDFICKQGKISKGQDLSRQFLGIFETIQSSKFTSQMQLDLLYTLIQPDFIQIFGDLIKGKEKEYPYLHKVLAGSLSEKDALEALAKEKDSKEVEFQRKSIEFLSLGECSEEDFVRFCGSLNKSYGEGPLKNIIKKLANKTKKGYSEFINLKEKISVLHVCAALTPIEDFYKLNEFSAMRKNQKIKTFFDEARIKIFSDVRLEADSIEKIMTILNPINAIISYRAIIEENKDYNAGECFSEFLQNVGNGTFEKNRYDENKSFHLKTVFETNPKLRELWVKNKSKAIDTETLNFTDDPRDMFFMGTGGGGDTCQSIYDTRGLNLGLLGNMMNGRTKIITLKDNAGNVMGRCLLRLLWDKESNKPVLFKELTYSRFKKDLLLKSKIEDMAKEIAKDLGLPLLSGRGGMAYNNPIEGLEDRIPLQYLDYNKVLIRKSDFIYEGCNVLYEP